MMMMVVVLVPVFQIVVVIVLGGPGPRVARLQFLVQVVRQLPDHLRRVVLLLLVLRGPLLQPMMKRVHAVRLGQLRLVIVVMVMVMVLQLMMRRHAQQNRVVVIPRRRPVL